MVEQRRYIRLPLSGMVRYTAPTEEDESPAPQEGRLLDMCINGAGFTVPEPLPEGSLLRIELAPEADGLPTLKCEAVLSGCAALPSGEERVSCRFIAADEPTVVRLMLHAYSQAGSPYPFALSQRAWMCSEEELAEWTFFLEGKNCWEVDNPPCAANTPDDCYDCPYAALSFLLWEEPQRDERANA